MFSTVRTFYMSAFTVQTRFAKPGITYRLQRLPGAIAAAGRRWRCWWACHQFQKGGSRGRQVPREVAARANVPVYVLFDSTHSGRGGSGRDSTGPRRAAPEIRAPETGLILEDS